MSDHFTLAATNDALTALCKLGDNCSRINPKSWTEEDFLKENEINHENRTIKPR